VFGGKPSIFSQNVPITRCSKRGFLRNVPPQNLKFFHLGGGMPPPPNFKNFHFGGELIILPHKPKIGKVPPPIHKIHKILSFSCSFWRFFEVLSFSCSFWRFWPFWNRRWGWVGLFGIACKLQSFSSKFSIYFPYFMIENQVTAK